MAKTMQDFTGTPFHSTVHAPQRPTTQPKCVPVNRKLSRRKCASNVRDSTSPEHGLPLTVKFMFLSMSRFCLCFLDQSQNSFRCERRLANLDAKRAQRIFHCIAKRRRWAKHTRLARSFCAQRGKWIGGNNVFQCKYRHFLDAWQSIIHEC